MRKNSHFHLIAVKPTGDFRLLLSYADGAELAVDLADWIKSTKSLKPLLDRDLFSSVRVGEWPGAIEFGDGAIDLAADNLRNLAIEQAGGVGHERIWNWMNDNDLSLEQGAEALGISRRMLIYYRNGEKPIPLHIWLACVGWETLHKHGAAA